MCNFRNKTKHQTYVTIIIAMTGVILVWYSMIQIIQTWTWVSMSYHWEICSVNRTGENWNTHLAGKAQTKKVKLDEEENSWQQTSVKLHEGTELRFRQTREQEKCGSKSSTLTAALLDEARKLKNTEKRAKIRPQKVKSWWSSEPTRTTQSCNYEPLWIVARKIKTGTMKENLERRIWSWMKATECWIWDSSRI
jgi:hypothetical protein